MIIGNLEPKKVMQFFEAIAAVPRPSKKEKQISDFLVAFAKERNFEVVQDEFLNVIIKKPATPGYEKAAPVILQGHMDMVAEANKDTKHDFEKDPISLQIDGKFIRAKGTTLGADDGIAVAMMMAILDSNDIQHPALEMFITSDEEAGMTGAINFDPKHFKGRRMINIDTEESAKIYVSCAGGGRTELAVPYKTQPSSGKAYHVFVRGLVGGHSGMQIHEQHGNSNKLLGRALNSLLQKGCEFHLVSFAGGSKENAIPREADAIIFVSPDKASFVEQEIKKLDESYKTEFAISDTKVALHCEAITCSDPMLTLEDTKRVVDAISLHPYGVRTMSSSIPGLVQSSANLGVVIQKDGVITLVSLLRSSSTSEFDWMLEEIQSLTQLVGGKFLVRDTYPAWEYNPHSSLRDVAVKLGKDIFGQEVEVKAIHAGLECGIIGEKFDGTFDAISIGPDIFAPHTPDEHIDIASVKPTYDWLLKILAALKP